MRMLVYEERGAEYSYTHRSGQPSKVKKGENFRNCGAMVDKR